MLRLDRPAAALALALALAAAAKGQAAQVTNMNTGGEYLFANPNPDSSAKYDTDFGTRYPGSQREYFEVHAGPINTRYGEVFWQGLPAVPLPKEIVERYAGKVIAITGYEQDQVIKEEGKPDKSVPIYWAYNHHYVAWLKGRAATMVNLTDDGSSGDSSVTGHPLLMNAFALDDPNPSSTIPTSQMFSEGNGGESRKSYHGYPQTKAMGYAQLLESPEKFVITPMQIDTWNRNKSYGEPYSPGPEPAASTAPVTGPDAVYSGHLECPCTDRITKHVINTYATQAKGACSASGMVTEAEQCFLSASEVGVPEHLVIRNLTVNSASSPAGCSLFYSGDNYTVSFNTHAASGAAECGASSTAGVKLEGTMTSFTTFKLELEAKTATATMTLTGPADVWFGVGLGAQKMKDQPNAVVVLGNGTVFEQKLADQSPGSPLPMSLTVLSNTVADGLRTVVVTRPLKGKTPQHYSFNIANPTLPYINAVGKGPVFAYHKSKAAVMLNLKLVGAPTCVCSTGRKAYISSDMNPHLQPFSKNCAAEPHGDLLALKNPTCTIESYAGGLKCCKSGNILLDKHQNPWINNTLSYYMKWRFYFQDYVAPTPSKGKPASHQNLVRFFKETEANAGEYDVVKAPAGTKPEDTVYQITAHFQAREGVSQCNPRTSPHCSGTGAGINLIYASCHCHAPSCLGCELWNADTGKLICRQVPHVGKAKSATTANPYDEVGYIAIPPCLYGDADDGLLPPPYMAYNSNLTSIKRNNNTYGHYGEMAMWQMRGYQSYENGTVVQQ